MSAYGKRARRRHREARVPIDRAASDDVAAAHIVLDLARIPAGCLMERVATLARRELGRARLNEFLLDHPDDAAAIIARLPPLLSRQGASA